MCRYANENLIKNLFQTSSWIGGVLIFLLNGKSMKLIILSLSFLFPLFTFAASGYEQVQQQFTTAKTLDLKNLKYSARGLYIGRCFSRENNYPLGAFASFTDYSKNSGPIKTDPELYVAWGANNISDYFDNANIDILQRTQQMKLKIERDDISYEYNHPYNWLIQFRQTADYIVQRNQENGIDHSYCYYYHFRSR